ncbi:hypothetical protein H257_10528 [Aphanomyces astaci]|uniref:Uncharacterized protein n=1 Tax=Aphanomyces astaci TaxID=112090 RepID=W4G755_APHAT|nr:hypothetical protein H257_10528 [Aphanomyces astaci]ETV74899.1 hypothetical protein H257_10528 [Aphanomyces astaci]|eukprot:XP_009835403.1 hypothetical protein H257_10528 [Aphanomyces astaci]
MVNTGFLSPSKHHAKSSEKRRNMKKTEPCSSKLQLTALLLQRRANSKKPGKLGRDPRCLRQL